MALAIEVIRADTGASERFTFTSSPVRIGRSPLNNVVLVAPWVSLHHGLIHFDDQQATYSDLGSTNGTTVFVHDQERRLHPMVPVQILAGLPALPAAGVGEPQAAELRLGAITLRVGWASENRPIAAALPPGLLAPEAGPGGGRRQFETRLTLGDLKAFQDEMRNQARSRADHQRGSSPDDPYGGPALGPDGRPVTRIGSHQSIAPPAATPERGAPVYQAGFTRVVGTGDRVTPPPAMPTPPPAGGAPHFHGSEKAFVESLAAVADAFARGLIELKKGLKEFGEGLGVRAVGGHSPLHRSQTAGDVMAYLLEPGADIHQRLEQLVDLFADLMIHEVALLNGVKAGVRKLLTELDPEGGYAQSAEGKGGKGGLFDRSLRRYQEYFQSVTEDGGESVVFGAEFARAYANALGGERSPGRRRP
jgi:hypothetical protein